MANRLTITLQPEESIALTIMNKTPSLTQGGYELQPLTLNLSLLDAFKGEKRRRIAYERLLLEAISDNSTLVRAPRRSGSRLGLDRPHYRRLGAHRASSPAPVPVWKLGTCRRLRPYRTQRP